MIWNEDKGVFEIGPTSQQKNVSALQDIDFDVMVDTQEERLEMISQDNKTLQENYMKKTLSKTRFCQVASRKRWYC